jgi:hypothetical protein
MSRSAIPEYRWQSPRKRPLSFTGAVNLYRKVFGASKYIGTCMIGGVLASQTTSNAAYIGRKRGDATGKRIR